MALKCKTRTSSWTETWSKLLNGKCFAVYKSIFRPYQTFKIEGFAKIVDGWKSSIFAKRSIPDVWKRSENVEQVYTCRVKKQYSSSKEKILERDLHSFPTPWKILKILDFWYFQVVETIRWSFSAKQTGSSSITQLQAVNSILKRNQVWWI